MTSKTKQNISENIVSEIFNRHGLGKVTSIKVMTGGKFNTVLKVKTNNHNLYAIKIAPKDDTEVLTYEHQLIKSELYIYKLLEQVKSIKFPKIYGYNWENNYPYKYLIMEFIDGDMLSNVKLSSQQFDNVMFDLGKAMAEIHTIVNENGFGYIQNGLKSSWKEAYFDMIKNIVEDGLSKQAKIPYLEKIKEIIKNNKDVLDSVKTPSLIHFDLWFGNIIIKEHELYALIDCERAMFGDIMGEFISLDYLSAFDSNKNKKLIDGYNSISDIKVKFDKEELIRFYLMRIYLGLIAYVETYYRFSKINPEFYGSRIFAKNVLHNAIKEIEKIDEKG